MSEKIKVFIVNRNLLTTLKNTVDFLLKESRVELIIFDQQSSYSPLLEYYKTCGVRIIHSPINGGPHSTWGLTKEFNDNYFILTDPDCDYSGVPNDWLDRMLNVLKNSDTFKVGFSLEISDIPEHTMLNDIKAIESRYWVEKNEWGWVADIDTTFALYRPYSPFSYRAVRLDYPYCIKHIPWYITKENINDEWKYYLDNVIGVSTWGSKLKNIINE